MIKAAARFGPTNKGKNVVCRDFDSDFDSDFDREAANDHMRRAGKERRQHGVDVVRPNSLPAQDAGVQRGLMTINKGNCYLLDRRVRSPYCHSVFFVGHHLLAPPMILTEIDYFFVNQEIDRDRRANTNNSQL